MFYVYIHIYFEAYVAVLTTGARALNCAHSVIVN